MSDAAPPLLAAEGPEALPAGTRVAEFEIRRLLGSGGFGIVYLAWDHALEREVALKEYMPGTLAGRGNGLQVSVRSRASADTFALGLRSFINEGRLLARFDHPSLVKVYRFWEDNGTAYMVMPYYVGRNLRQVRQGMVVPPGEAACRRVLDALLSALECLHREGVYHRDIAPDNILIGDDGVPVLLDFGAARRVLSDRTQALTSIMKPHYAPLEQYADANAMRQGPWTDLYALGGTMVYLLTGDEPVAAASRALHDDQPRMVELRPRDCSAGFLAAIDWMLALKPPERPQSVHMLRDVLEGRITMPGRVIADKTAPGVASRTPAPAPVRSPVRTDLNFDDALPSAPLDSGHTNNNANAVTELQMPTTASAAAVAAAATASPAPPATSAGRSPRLLALLGALLVLNLLAWWWFTRPGPQPATPTMATSTSTVPAITASSAAAAAPGARAEAPAAVEAAAGETILSVLPARGPAARSAGAASVPSGGPGAVAARPRSPADAAAPPSVPRLSANAGPRERCGDRVFLSLLICIKRECDQPALQSHPECVKMREQEEVQRERRQ